MRQSQLLAAILLIAIGTVAAAQTAAPDSTALRGGTGGVGAFQPALADPYFLRNRLDGQVGYLTMSLNLNQMDWYRPPTRLEAVVYGAGTGATVGMFVGAIGNTLGWFDEGTTWAITGALATMGAAYQGARYEPEPLRLRFTTR